MPRVSKSKGAKTFRMHSFHERGDRYTVRKMLKLKPNEAAALAELALDERTTQSEMIRLLLRREYVRRQQAAQQPPVEAT